MKLKPDKETITFTIRILLLLAFSMLWICVEVLTK